MHGHMNEKFKKYIYLYLSLFIHLFYRHKMYFLHRSSAVPSQLLQFFFRALLIEIITQTSIGNFPLSMSY